ncbi:MAG: 2-phosphosulfolactate phosphatase [Fuerstiella sp.]|nr:2-phosphosulfolactate phosphatase [Fuerstiella sp.]MCP4786148.1 2-phosphosulfolactate phosphatase [Fuerstiella sp.]MCP4859408.1 2-phosphosulfolactate phosphatase [Fuerstiella sp.]
MLRPIFVHLLPTLFEPDDVVGGIAVVVDILRATTTITHALANGVECVIPCGSIEEALAAKNDLPTGTCLLGGERGGVRIDGFDLSNSPDDYGPDVVKGKSIGFTTTNGTRALIRAEKADHVLIGAFVNLSAVTDRLRVSGLPVHIVCAGTNGQITGEDVLFAGAVVNQLLDRSARDFETSDSARIALNYWRQESGNGSTEALQAALRRSQGGRNLIELGYDRDITTAADTDSVPWIGTLNEARTITACVGSDQENSSD